MFLKYLETKNVLIFSMFLAVLDARLNVLKIQMFLFGFVPRQENVLKMFKPKLVKQSLYKLIYLKTKNNNFRICLNKYRFATFIFEKNNLEVQIVQQFCYFYFQS